MAVALAVATLTLPTPAQNSVPYPSMGINMGGVLELQWINLWHSINPWHSAYGENPLTIGVDGWPVAGRQHRLVIAGDVNNSLSAGIYKISFKGRASQILVHGSPVRDGTETWSGIYRNIRDDFPTPGYAYMEIHYANVAGTIEFYIDGHIEQVKVMRPGFEISDTRTLLPKLTDLLKPYSTLRFKDFVGTDQHDAFKDGQVDFRTRWADRVSPNTPQSYSGLNTSATDKGGAWEYVLSIANELDKDAWISIPIKADDDYIRQLALLIKGNLKPTLKIYIEMGNEIWNFGGGFHCFQKTKEMCVLYRNSGDPAKTALFADLRTRQIDQAEFDKAATEPTFGAWTAHERFAAFRLREVIDIFASVFGWSEVNNRFRAVLCGQIGYGAQGHGWCVGPGIDFLESYYGEGTTRKYLYAVGAAPYFNAQGQLSTVDLIMAGCRDNIDNHIFGEFSGDTAVGGLDGNALEGWLGYAGQYGLKLLCYEGGPDLDYTAVAPDGVRLAAYRDQRMKDLCLSYWSKWYSRYGYDATFCFFYAGINHSGLYTFAESIDTISTRQAAMYQIMANPAPAFDTTVRHMVPGLIDPRKVSGYNSDWNDGDVQALQFQRTATGSNKWTIAANRNGSYTFAIEHATSRDNVIDVYLDGVPVRKGVVLPATGGGWDTWTWSDAQGVTIPIDISYGIHVLRFVYRDCDDNFRKFRFDLVRELPPFMPAPVSGDLIVAAGNPSAQYSVPIDRSVISYEWDESAILAAGARLLPPSGGTGTVRTGQGTAQVFVDWSTVPVGTYNLRVRGTNAVGSSPWRDFTVTVVPGLFTTTPNPACVTAPVVFTPVKPAGTREWRWEFGPSGAPYTLTDTTGAPVTVNYGSAGNKAVKLTLKNSSGQLTSFISSLQVGQSAGGTASASPATVTAGDTSNIYLQGQSGRVIRWQRSVDGASWTDMPTVDLPLATGPMGQTLWFRAVTRDGGCDEALSTAAKVTVTNPVNPGRVSPDTTVGSGASITMRLTGNGGTVKRWEKSVSPYASWSPIAATTGTLPTGALTQTTQYRAVVTINGTDYNSLSATVTVTAAPAVNPGRVSPDTSIVAGSSAGTLRLADNDGTVLRWESSVDPFSAWITIATTASSYSPGVLSRTTRLRAVVQVGGVEYQSAYATVTVLPPNVRQLAVPSVQPTGGSYPQRLLTVRFAPMGQDSVADIYFVVCPSQTPCPMTNAVLYRDSVVLDIAAGPKAIRFEARPKPGRESRWSTSTVDSALYVHSPRVLGVPVPRPGSGNAAADTLRVFFESTDQSALRRIYYRICADTLSCTLDSLNRQLYDSTRGILLDLSSGQRGIVFQAHPLTAYTNSYSSSTVGRALYTYRPEFSVRWAAYFDANADGRIDSARFELNAPAPRAPQRAAFTPPSGGATVNATVRMRTPTLFDAPFAQTPFPVILTGFAQGLYGRLSDSSGLFSTQPFSVDDSVAPVILSATYARALSASSGAYFDTLQIAFSEPVTVAGAQPLSFTGRLSALSVASYQTSSSAMTVIIQQPEASALLPGAGDSVYISTGAGATVRDTRGLAQNNPANRRVHIALSAQPDPITVASGPVPFHPANGGVYTIALRTIRGAGELSAADHASVSITDATGGLVATAQFQLEGGMLVYRWDGRNRDGRLVGQATYVVTVKTTVAGVSKSRKLKVGVQR